MKNLPITKITIVTLILTLTFIPSQTRSPQTFTFKYDSHMIPHPEKAHRGGQDAYHNSSKILVVADGVGGWNNQGVDPSKYSRFLCSAAENYVKQNPQLYLRQPKQILIRAQKQNTNLGSSTMVVLTLDKNNLKYCYIGDSGFMLIRKYQKYVPIYEYVEQQHSFNFPYQLAMDSVGGDNPRDSICGTLELQQGDIIVVGSDGLYDNMEFHEVFLQVEKAVKDGILLDGLAKYLASTAITRGADETYNSPFAQRAKKYRLRYKGGKLDDTTVIVAQVGYQNQNQDNGQQLGQDLQMDQWDDNNINQNQSL